MSVQTATVSPAELRRRLADPGTRLLDVRTPGEFAAGRVPGSHNVPLPDLPRYAGDLAAKADGLVVVCQSGGRARQAAELLGELGPTGATVLDGGLDAWRAAGGDVTGDSGPAWTIERQVRLVAGSLVAGSILASLKFPKARFLAGGVGSGLVFAAVSNTCLMGTVLARLPHNRGSATDVDAAVSALLA